jgi:hypothetical protein
MKYTKEQKQNAYRILKRNYGERFAAIITSVSKSGMSRRIKFYAADFQHVGYYIAVLLDLPWDDCKGLRVDGCGMDMIFDVLSRLNFIMAELDTTEERQAWVDTNPKKMIGHDYFTDANHYTLL